MNLEDFGIAIQHHFGGGVYVKETHIPAMHVLDQHSHKFDHLSFLASGRVLLEVGGDSTIYDGPIMLTIKAGKRHKVTTYTDTLWLCIHATNETDEDTIDEVLIHEAY
jgi:quercetin dioxygenase-like cupin family protein